MRTLFKILSYLFFAGCLFFGLIIIKNTIDLSKHNEIQKKYIKELQTVVKNDSIIFNDLLVLPIDNKKDVEEIIFRLNKRNYEFY